MPTRWRLDSCGCVLLPAPDISAFGVGLVAVEVVCPAHAGLAGAALFDAIRDETQRKSYLPIEAMEADGITAAQQQEIADLENQAHQLGIPAIYQMTPAQSQRYIRLRAFLSYQWSFTPARVLLAQFAKMIPPLTPAQKTAIQNRADARFGPGKAQVL